MATGFPTRGGRKTTRDVVIRKNDTRTRGKLEDQARQAEAQWRAKTPGAATLPPEEIRPTRAARRAVLEIQRMHGDKDAQKGAEELLRREWDKEREAEQLRPRRQRPHKQLPTGVASLTVVLEQEEGKVPSVRLSPEDAPEAQTMIHRTAAYRTLEVVTPELARDAAALRAAFDVEHNQITEPPVVAHEIADAIRLAAAVVSAAWISIALDLVHHALLHDIIQARGAIDFDKLNGQTPPPTTPAAIYEALVCECVRCVALPPPSDVNVRTIAWMLHHLAVGASRGGGRSKRMSAEKMRMHLADAKNRASIAEPQ